MTNTFNRIVLIGNGFDLSHGLPTSYGDFLFHQFKTDLQSVINSNEGITTPFYTITYKKRDKENWLKKYYALSRHFDDKQNMRNKIIEFNPEDVFQ